MEVVCLSVSGKAGTNACVCALRHVAAVPCAMWQQYLATDNYNTYGWKLLVELYSLWQKVGA